MKKWIILIMVTIMIKATYAQTSPADYIPQGYFCEDKQIYRDCSKIILNVCMDTGDICSSGWRSLTPDLPSGGRWGITKILRSNDNGSISFTTSALNFSRAARINAYYPPLDNKTKNYTLPYALVWMEGVISTDANTIMFPNIGLDAPLNQQFNTVQLNNFKNNLNKFPKYNYSASVMGRIIQSVCGCVCVSHVGTCVCPIPSRVTWF